MSDYRCPQCKTEYSSDEYNTLDLVPLNEDRPEAGNERVCECGARFSTDKWNLRDEVELSDGLSTVSTVSLLIPHGLEHDQWYETLVSHPSGAGGVERRYTTEEAAKDGHHEIVSMLEDGEFTLEPVSYRLTFEEDDA